jgi:hypothetical protein
MGSKLCGISMEILDFPKSKTSPYANVEIGNSIVIKIIAKNTE